MTMKSNLTSNETPVSLRGMASAWTGHGSLSAYLSSPKLRYKHCTPVNGNTWKDDHCFQIIGISNLHQQALTLRSVKRKDNSNFHYSL